MLNHLYSEIILENSRNTKNRTEMKAPSRVERGHNPNCGDDLTLMVKLQDDVIVDASFIGTGCAISTASMSLMIDLVKGKSIDEAQQMANVFLGMIQGNALSDSDLQLLKDCVVFQSLKDMPARVKCGTLGWHCLLQVVQDVAPGA